MPQDNREITGHLKVYEEGTRVDVISHYTNFGKRKGGGKRGDLSGGYSKQSRKRLYALLNSLREDAIRKALFVTLTYHRDHVEPEEAKRNLKAFLQAMRRSDPTCSGIWKLEFQERGSPHYHLLVFRRYIPHRWVAETWNRIAESGDRVHFAAGTEVRPVRRSDSAYAYVGKYMAKLEENGARASNWGRYWGVLNRRGLPLSKTRIIRLHGSTAREIIGKNAPRICGNNGDEVNALSIFTRSAEELQGFIQSINDSHEEIQ